jgi:hypothetical protein
MSVNPVGHPASLVAAHPGNTNASRHGVYARSDARLEARAAEVADVVAALPHTSDLDALAASEIGRLIALIEGIDRELGANGLTNRRGEAKALLKLRLGASRRLQEWLQQFAMTPRSRAAFVRETATGSLAAEIAARRHPEAS